MVEEYSFVKNEPKYYEFIRNLRLDKRVKPGFIKTNHITPEEQIKYMEKYSNCFYLCLIGDKPAGYIGVIDGDIRVATHPDFQRKGVGKYMINEMTKTFPSSFAKIIIDNSASLELFKSCGFKIKYYILEKE